MIKDNIFRVRERIALACSRIKAGPESITVVAVAKGRRIEEIGEVVASGISDIGENKVQEARLKFGDKLFALSSAPVKWHMVGHLQMNKVREAVKIFDLIHSVDSLRLAEKIDREAGRINKVQGILLEIKTSSEATKSGFSLNQAGLASREIVHFNNIKLKGLMTIAPQVSHPQEARVYFRALREFFNDINRQTEKPDNRLTILSMGMSDDFETAIEEGANIIRIGRAIFGN